MLDVLQNFQNVVDAPLQVILACPIGVIAALHFAGAPSNEIKGARCDQVVRAAKAEAVHRPAWIRTLGIGLGLSVAAGNFLFIQNPDYLSVLMNSLPF